MITVSPLQDLQDEHNREEQIHLSPSSVPMSNTAQSLLCYQCGISAGFNAERMLTKCWGCYPSR
eukprot:4695224-Amphidinium_carterae.1